MADGTSPTLGSFDLPNAITVLAYTFAQLINTVISSRVAGHLRRRFTNPQCRGFVGYGDAEPSNVSPLVHGAEMRVAETRAVNRALRKAYGIGICSVEEIGSLETRSTRERPIRKLPPDSSNGSNGHAGNGNGTRVRDRLSNSSANPNSTPNW